MLKILPLILFSFTVLIAHQGGIGSDGELDLDDDTIQNTENGPDLTCSGKDPNKVIALAGETDCEYPEPNKCKKTDGGPSPTRVNIKAPGKNMRQRNSYCLSLNRKEPLELNECKNSSGVVTHYAEAGVVDC